MLKKNYFLSSEIVFVLLKNTLNPIKRHIKYDVSICITTKNVRRRFIIYRYYKIGMIWSYQYNVILLSIVQILTVKLYNWAVYCTIIWQQLLLCPLLCQQQIVQFVMTNYIDLVILTLNTESRTKNFEISLIVSSAVWLLLQMVSYL